MDEGFEPQYTTVEFLPGSSFFIGSYIMQINIFIYVARTTTGKPLGLRFFVLGSEIAVVRFNR